MNYFEFRQWIESSISWWIPFVIPFVFILIGLVAMRFVDKEEPSKPIDRNGPILFNRDGKRLFPPPTRPPTKKG